MNGVQTKRRISIVTGSRADYGLLRWTLMAMAEDPDITPQLVVTGAHLDPDADSLGQIRDDGLSIDATMDMLLANDSRRATTKSLGLGAIGFADALDRLQPDLIVVLGDRYEILAAAQAAMMACIPIAHIHGGESTEGLIDEAVRHAVTKMSHIHLVAAEEYRRRVIQLGENPERVHVVGATGLDAIANLQLLERKELESQLGYPIGDDHLLVTCHPVALEPHGAAEALAPCWMPSTTFRNPWSPLPVPTPIHLGVNTTSGFRTMRKHTSGCISCTTSGGCAT